MANIKRVPLEISGMHCGSCAAGISMVLQNTDGVVSAIANYDTKSGEVEYDEEKIKLDDIFNAIQQLGYKASVKEAAQGTS